MRKSSKRHVIAVLREIIGMNQPEFAAFVDCSPSTIASVEMLRLKLSPNLSATISLKTGVSLSWLHENNPKAPPETLAGTAYSKEDFLTLRANPFIQKNTSPVPAEFTMQLILTKLLPVLAVSHKMGTLDLNLAKILNFIVHLQPLESPNDINRDWDSEQLLQDLYKAKNFHQWQMLANKHLFKVVSKFRDFIFQTADEAKLKQSTNAEKAEPAK